MLAELSLRHLKAIHAEFAEGRAESAPELGSTEIDDSQRDEIQDGSDNIISWVRKYLDRGERHVRFSDKVTVRPIPAEGKGRPCRGPARLLRRGS